MENRIRFRNHFSMALPDLKGIIIILAMAILTGLFGEEGGSASEVVISVLTWIAIAVVLSAYRIIIWAKTWITIEAQSIVIECNTFFSRKKNTISIKTISNINLEQSLMGMLFGTCKLKMDTNSLSTANDTDLTIVLKKNDAEELRVLLMGLVSGNEMPKQEIRQEEQRDSGCIRVNATDILLHGVFASKFLHTIFIPLYIVLEFVSEMDSADLEYIVDEVGYFAAETIGLWLLILIALIAWSILAIGFGLVRDAVRYWDFQIERKEEKLVLMYGLTKKVNYSIPVDKIQAVVLKQTLLARIFRRYMVEVVNVGMNDDEKEAQAFLLPYGKKELLKERMGKLLPEFSNYLELEAEHQPKSSWIAGLWTDFIYLMVVGGILMAVAEFVPEFLGGAIAILSVITFACLAVKVAGYLTKGTTFAEQVLLIVRGSFSRTFVYIRYDKIQYVSLYHNFLANRYGIQRGMVHLLASMNNQVQEIPYFKGEQLEVLKRRM